MERSKSGLAVGIGNPSDMAKFLELSKRIFHIPNVDPTNIVKIE